MGRWGRMDGWNFGNEMACLCLAGYGTNPVKNISWQFPKFDRKVFVSSATIGTRAANETLPQQTRAVSSVGRAPALQAGCHWFESSTAHTLSHKGSSDFKPA
jgi:hypothetical protein